MTDDHQSPIRVVVLGTGSIGMRHLRILQAMPGVVPTAVPARPGRVGELRAQGFAASESLEQALAGAHGALIATDSGRHVADALRCLEVCPVLVEKPLAPSVAAASALKPKQRPVHVACVLRFDEGLRWVAQRLAQLGPLRLADAECLSWLPHWRPGRDLTTGYGAREGEGGVLLDLIHEVDTCLRLFGPVRHVSGVLENRGALGLPATVEESAFLTLEHEAGVTATVRLSYTVRPPTRRLRIYGEAGLLEWDGIARQARHVGIDGETVEGFEWASPETKYIEQAKAWVSTLQGGSGQGLATFADGLAAVAVCDAARESSAKRRRVA